jgi:hypothetical protein
MSALSPFPLVFGVDCDQHQVEHLGTVPYSFQRFIQMDPAGGKELPFRLAKRFRHAGQPDSDTHHLIVLLAQDQRQEFQSQHRDIHIHVVVDLFSDSSTYPNRSLYALLIS